MQAIILAAGCGSRMGSDKPKVLLDLHGQTLLEHQLHTLSSLGVDRFIVVVGYQGEKVEQFIARKRLDQRFKLTVVRNERWQEGNASSILAVRPYLQDERFVVVMGDHLFDPEPLHGFLKVRGDFVGVFDSTPRFVDISEATKALASRGHVTLLSKDLAEFRYVDTGLFICSQRVFPFIEACLAEGVGTFNEVKRRWIAAGQVLHIFDCQGGFWMDVDTPNDLAKVRLILGARLSKRRDGPISRHINRYLSIPLSRWLVRHTEITPDQITVGVFILSVLSAVLFYRGPGLASAIGGLLTQIASIVDGCDGEVSRLRHAGTSYGAWLDSTLDRLADALLIGGMSCGAWHTSGMAWVWLLGFLALTGSLAIPYSEARYESAFGQSAPFEKGLPAKRDTRLLIVALGGLTGQFAVALGAIASLTLAEIVWRIVQVAIRPPHSLAGA